jgi:hypothetical protein
MPTKLDPRFRRGDTKITQLDPRFRGGDGENTHLDRRFRGGDGENTHLDRRFAGATDKSRGRRSEAVSYRVERTVTPAKAGLQ